MLFFNKQLRTEEKIIAELSKKIKKAETVYMHNEGNAEVYELPGGFWISFDVVTNKLEITNGGKKILDLDCKYYGYDDGYNNKLQAARYNWFSALLDRARKRLEKDEKLRQKTSKLKKARKSILAKKSKSIEQKALEAVLQEIREA